MKNLLLTTALAALSAPVLAEMPQVEPILSVTPVSGPSTEVRICAGTPGGAYHSIASQMLGLVQSAAGVPVSVESCGGTVGSLRKLATGEAEAAIVQLDGLVWIKDTAPDLYAKIAPAAAVLTEDMIGVCRRDSDYEDLNDIAQERGATIAIAGSEESGSLLTLNVLAGFDDDFAAPDTESRVPGNRLWATCAAASRSAPSASCRPTLRSGATSTTTSATISGSSGSGTATCAT